MNRHAAPAIATNRNATWCIRERLRAAESFIQMLTTWFFVFLTTFLTIVITIENLIAPPWRHLDRTANVAGAVGLTLLLLLLLTIHLPILRATFDARTDDEPFALATAMRYGRWPLLLRPLASVWWFAHFGLVISAILATEMSNQAHPDQVTTLASQVLPVVRTVAVVFLLTFASNAFLLLTVGAFTQRPAVLRNVYRLRVPFDLMVSIVSLLILL